MCEWLVRSNTQQRQMHGIVPSVMPCIARKYLRHRNAMYFYKDLNFCYFLFKQKVRRLNSYVLFNIQTQKALQFKYIALGY